MKNYKFYTTIIATIFALSGIVANAQPTWNVNANNFVYSMTITGQVTTDGYVSEDENDILAAFIDGECRGLTNVDYQGAIDKYFVFLQIFSNDPTGTVTFKIYDHSENQIIDVKETINFTVNDIVGSISNPFVFSASNLSSDAKILSFSIPNQVGETLISGNDVYLQEHWSGNLTGITPSFVLSDGAKAFVNGVEQTSGTSANDFINTVEYTIEAADLSATTIFKVHITTANDIPTDILLNITEREENVELTFIGAFTVVTDNPNETHVFSLVNKQDSENQYFYINGSGLRARQPFNYEEKSSYKIYVRADDEKGGVVEKFFTIRVKDMNDSPTNIILQNSNTPVNVPANTVIGNLVAIDEDAGDTHTFTLFEGNGTNDADNQKFKIVGDQLINTVPIPFLPESAYHILVQAEDAQGAAVIIPMIISTQNQGNPPHNLMLSNTLVIGIDNPPVFVGELTTDDVDQESGHQYSLPLNSEFGPDNNYFSIVNNTLYLNTNLSASEKGIYEILVGTTDSMGNQFTKAFLIVVKAELGEQGFYLNNNQLQENKPFNTIVGFFDSDIYRSEEYTFSLPLEVDLNTYCNDEFKLNGRTLITNQVFDYEQENSVLIQVDVSDGIKTIKHDIPVIIVDQNDPPTAISLSTQILSESAAVNSVVASLTADDQDFGDSHEFSLVVGNGINDQGNNLFKISNGNLILAKKLNYEAQEFHNILLRVTDSKGATFEQGLRLQIADANDAPEITSKPVGYVLQNQVYVYEIQINDSEGDPVSLSFEGLPDWLSFLPGSNILTGAASNENVGIYSFTVHASDGKKESVQEIVLTVIDVNDPPEINYYLGTQDFYNNRENEIQIPFDCITDPDEGDVLTFSLARENNLALPDWLIFDAANLLIKGNPPHDARGVYRLKLTATDKGKLKEWMVFELEVSFPTAAGFNETAEFRVYPNPVQNELHFSIPNAAENAEIHIQNIDGKEIKVYHFSYGTKNQIPVHDLSPGIYFIKLLQGENQMIEKIVKQ